MMAYNVIVALHFILAVVVMSQVLASQCIPFNSDLHLAFIIVKMFYNNLEFCVCSLGLGRL